MVRMGRTKTSCRRARLYNVRGAVMCLGALVTTGRQASSQTREQIVVCSGCG